MRVIGYRNSRITRVRADTMSRELRSSAAQGHLRGQSPKEARQKLESEVCGEKKRLRRRRVVRLRWWHEPAEKRSPRPVEPRASPHARRPMPSFERLNRRYGPWVSLALGVAAVAYVRRGLGFAPVAVGVLMLAWIGAAALRRLAPVVVPADSAGVSI